QHHAFRRILLEAREHAVELAQHIHGQGVGAGVRLVDNEPGDAVVIAGELEVAPGRARLRAAGERTELEIARREYLPGLSHLAHAHLCWMLTHAADSVLLPLP